MTITHQPTSTPYQLHPSSQLAVERTNPFFHDYAEQTVPLDVPASDHNRTLLGYPDILGQPLRQPTADAAISDGEYHAVCRQAVLSAQRKGNISISFYINDGALYSRLQKERLRDVFRDEAITFGGNNLQDKVSNAIDECRKIRTGESAYCDRLAVFPILVKDDSGNTEQARKYKAVNLIDLATNDFEGARARTETVNGTAVNLSPGYYISPFAKTAYVLRRLFAHYGYTLLPSLLTDTDPFTGMVFLNNVIDTIVNGRISFADILPDVTVSDTLALFRKKFRCEFTANEQDKTVSVVFLKDMTDAAPLADLTHCLTEEPTIQYKAAKDYRRTVLKAKETVDEDPDQGKSYTGKPTSYDNIASLAQANPAAFLNPATGYYFRPMGYTTGLFRAMVLYQPVADTATMPYDTGEDTEKDDVEIPERLPSMRSLYGAAYLCIEQRIIDGNTGAIFAGNSAYRKHIYPYVGEYMTANSTLSSDNGETNTDTSEKPIPLPMLCLSFTRNGKSIGTTTAYDPNQDTPTRLSDYALHYHGEDGIFEKFHRTGDTLERNALDTVKMRLLIPPYMKQSLPSTAKVTVRGTALLIDKLKFTLGGKDAPQECDFRTILLPEEQSEAPHVADLLPHTLWDYHWETHSETADVTEMEYLTARAAMRDYLLEDTDTAFSFGEKGTFCLETPTEGMQDRQLHPFTRYTASGGTFSRYSSWYQVHKTQ